jgi:hypothetical protein
MELLTSASFGNPYQAASDDRRRRQRRLESLGIEKAATS